MFSHAWNVVLECCSKERNHPNPKRSVVLSSVFFQSSRRQFGRVRQSNHTKFGARRIRDPTTVCIVRLEFWLRRSVFIFRVRARVVHVHRTKVHQSRMQATIRLQVAHTMKSYNFAVAVIVLGILCAATTIRAGERSGCVRRRRSGHQLHNHKVRSARVCPIPTQPTPLFFATYTHVHTDCLNISAPLANRSAVGGVKMAASGCRFLRHSTNISVFSERQQIKCKCF